MIIETRSAISLLHLTLSARPAPGRRAAADAAADNNDPGYLSRKTFESFERINSIRVTNRNFDSCNSCKLLGTSRLHELHESKFSVCDTYRIYPLETFEFFCSCIRSQCVRRREGGTNYDGKHAWVAARGAGRLGYTGELTEMTEWWRLAADGFRAVVICGAGNRSGHIGDTNCCVTLNPPAVSSTSIQCSGTKNADALKTGSNGIKL